VRALGLARPQRTGRNPSHTQSSRLRSTRTWLCRGPAQVPVVGDRGGCDVLNIMARHPRQSPQRTERSTVKYAFRPADAAPSRTVSCFRAWSLVMNFDFPVPAWQRDDDQDGLRRGVAKPMHDASAVRPVQELHQAPEHRVRATVISSGAIAVARTTAARWPRSGSWRRSGRRQG